MAAPQVPWITNGEAVAGLGAATDIVNRPLKFVLTQSGMDVDALGFTGFMPVFNAKSYQAKGDGITDDRAVIQAAIDACSLAGGGITYCPVGKYLLSGRLKMKLGVRLLGAQASFLGLVSWPGTTFLLKAGYTDPSVVSFYAYEDNGVLFLGNAGAEHVTVDYTNAPTCGAIAFDLKSVSNCGPWRNLRTVKQDVGAALKLGISQVAGAQPCEGLSFYDCIFTDSTTVDPTDTGPVVILGGAPGVATSQTIANEILFTGCKIGRRGSGGVNVAGSTAVLIDSGSSGVRFVGNSLVGREAGIRIVNSAGLKPTRIRTFANTFESYRYGVAIDGTAGQTKPQFVVCLADDFVSNSTTGANPRNYRVDYGANCKFFPDEGAPGSGVSVEFTANATDNEVYGGPAGVIDALASNRNGVYGRNTTNGAWQANGAIQAGTRLLSGLPTPSEAVLVSGVDASLGNAVQVTLTAARVVGAPVNPVTGQRLAFFFAQDGTGGRAVTWNAVFKHGWVDTGNTANKRSSIAFVYDGTNWNQESAQAPYV